MSNYFRDSITRHCEEAKAKKSAKVVALPKALDMEARYEMIREAVEKIQPVYGSLVIGQETWQ